VYGFDHNGPGHAGERRRRFGRGHSEKFWEVVDLYRGELLKQAHAIVGSDADAEDVVQETFCDALRDPRKLARAQSVRAWLRALNRFNALARVRARHAQRDQRMASNGDPATTGGFSGLERQEALGQALACLPAEMRDVVTRRYWKGLTVAQIAAELKTSESTVKRLLFEANLRMYAKLGG